MAIFKILKGDSSRISLEITPFHEGWAYFTPDNGALYIDAIVNGEQKRIRINPSGGGTVTPVNATLLVSGWESGKQVLNISDITEDTNGIIGLPSNVTDEQMIAATNAELYLSEQGNGFVTVTALGELPQVNIPVAILVF